MKGLSSLLVAAASCFFVTSVIAQPDGYLKGQVQVRFLPGADLSPPLDAISAPLQPKVASIKKLFSLSDAELINLSKAEEGLPDLRLWYVIVLVAGADTELFLSELQLQPNVDVADFAPDASPPPTLRRHLQATPDLEAEQRYLDAAPVGIDARFIWTIAGGDGSGVKVYDVEYSWTQNHEDLAAAAGVTPLIGPGLTPYPYSPDHGTAVLGVLVGTDNAFGVTGICPAADVGLAHSHEYGGRSVVAESILLAVQDGSPGDVILLEAQTTVCGLEGGLYGPVEWDQAVFDAIQTATANRFTVVEAAGNGNVNLDQDGCLNRFNRADRDSGAIIVGAGEPGTAVNARSRRATSSYGSRVDLQCWGGAVVTTGYGNWLSDPDPADVTRDYTKAFGGTSAASSIVAGAVVSLQGVAKELFGTPLLPFQLRKLLVDTGTPQTGDLTKKIGPLPDLHAAYALLTAGKLDVLFLVDTTNSFAPELPFFKADAPTIMANIKAVNSNTRFALATFRDFPFSPWGGSGDYVYRREIDLTWDTLLVTNTIQSLVAGGGNDPPESQLEAIYQAITGEGITHNSYVLPGGSKINFRPDAVKIIALWTDAEFHKPPDYPGKSFTEVITAIETLGRRRGRALAEETSPLAPRVVGITFGDEIKDLIALVDATGAVAPTAGVDCNSDGTIDITEGQPIICPGQAKGIGSAFIAVVESVVETLIPVALCKDITLSASATECSFNATINNGSYDPKSSTLVITQSPPGPYEAGVTPVTLRVANEVGLSATCTGVVTVNAPIEFGCPTDVTTTCNIFLNIPLIGWLLNLLLGWLFCALGFA